MFLPHVLSLTLVLTGQPAGKPSAPSKEAPRRLSAVAPSLPGLTLEEEAKLDAIIDRFIRFDTGKLRGPEGQKALKEFEALGREAIPALIRGLNRAVEIDHSCPTLVISRKLNRMLMASQDVVLLEYARDEIGAGVGRTRHAGVLQDMKFQCLMRKNALLRAGIGVVKAPSRMTSAELVQALSKERGPRLKQVLTELETRKGPEVPAGLIAVLANPDKEIQTLSRTLLERNLVRQGAVVVREKLKDDNAEVRKAAIRAAGRTTGMAGDLIEQLNDGQTDVRDEARAALVKLSGGQDYGPALRCRLGPAAASDRALEVVAGKAETVSVRKVAGTLRVPWRTAHGVCLLL